MPHLSGGFGFEEAWLRKGLKEFVADNKLFNNANMEKARTLLGMGPYQIKDLKDWLIAANLVNTDKKNFVASPLALLFYKYDREFSEDGTFWIIHNFISLNSNITKSRIWFYYWYVNEFISDKFTREDLYNSILLSLRDTTKKIADKFYISPLRNTMKETRLGKSFGIMVEDGTNQFKRIEPPEDKLDPIIVAYITVDWAKRNERNSANLTELTGSKESPGKILHLSTRRYCEYLDKIQAMFNKEILWVSYTAGLNSVAFEKNINPLDILKAYYIKKRDEISTLDAYYKAKDEIFDPIFRITKTNNGEALKIANETGNKEND